MARKRGPPRKVLAHRLAPDGPAEAQTQEAFLISLYVLSILRYFLSDLITSPALGWPYRANSALACLTRLYLA